MVSKTNDSSGETPDADAPGRKKSAVKPVTLDLEATEVKAEPAEAPAKPATEPKAEPAATKADAAEGTPGKTADKGAAKPADKVADKGSGGETAAAREPVRTKGDDRGNFRLIVAALIGALMALAINFTLEALSLLPFGPSLRLAETETKLRELRGDVSVLGAKQTEQASAAVAALAALEGRVGQIEVETNKLPAAAAPAANDKMQALEAAVGSLQTGLAELQAKSGSSGVAALTTQVGDLTGQFAAARQTTAELFDALGNEMQAMKERVGALEAQPATDTGAPAAATDMVGPQIAELAARIAAAEGQLGGLAALGDRLQAIEARLADGAAGENVALDTLAADIAGLKNGLVEVAGVAAAAKAGAESAQQTAANAPAPAIDPELVGKVEAIAGETAMLSQSLAEQVELADGQRVRIDEVAGQVTTLATQLGTVSGDRLGQLEAQVAELAGRDPGERIAVLDQGVADLGSGLEAVKGSVAGLKDQVQQEIAAVGQTIAGLGDRVAAAEARFGDAPARDQAATAVAVSALQSAVGRGGPFRTELTAVASLGADSAAVAALEPFADRGVPTSAAIIEAFRPVSDRILESEAPAAVEEDGGILNRFLSNAKGMVKIRPAGPIEGSDTPAIVSRITAAVETGDLAAAYGEWDSLPEPAKAVSAEWADAVKARVEAERIVAEMVNSVLSSLGSSGQ